MPNGGMLPCCFICKWANRSTEDPASTDPIECQKHRFSVMLPLFHFCSELSDSSGDIHVFVRREDIASSQMYAWIEVQYRTAEHATIPRYHHEFVPVAAMSVYGSWAEEEKKAEYERLRDKKRDEFEQKYKPQSLVL